MFDPVSAAGIDDIMLSQWQEWCYRNSKVAFAGSGKIFIETGPPLLTPSICFHVDGMPHMECVHALICQFYLGHTRAVKTHMVFIAKVL
jgi:hypothetical protein